MIDQQLPAGLGFHVRARLGLPREPVPQMREFR
jgi:hypothetical protein